MTNSVITQSRTMPQVETGTHHSWWRPLLPGLCFCVIAVVLLEAYFRLSGVGGGEYLQPDLQMGVRHIPGKLVIWRAEGFSNNRISSAGLRDSEHITSKAPGVYRIALLGDSVVEALQVDLNDTFGKLLERQLNKSNSSKPYETINFGCGSYSTGQEFLQYEKEGVKYKPDAIVLIYNRGDSMESVVTSKDRKRAEPRPYFYIDQSGQLKEDDSVLAANFDKLKPNPVRDWLRKNSAIYGVLNQADFSLTLNEPGYRKIKGWGNSFWNVVSFKARTDISRPYVPTNNVIPALAQQQNILYPDQDEMTVTKALIRKLVAQATKNGQKFILVIYPNLDHFAALSDQAKELKALANENHFACLDLSPSFLSDPQPRSNFALYHFNKKGHITVANQLFKMF